MKKQNQTLLIILEESAFFSPEYYQIMTHQNVKYLKINCYSVIEVENVDEVYKELKNKTVPIEIELRNEPWGDRHFAIKDPNGIGIDIVTYTEPE